MHIDSHEKPEKYKKYINRKKIILVSAIGLLFFLFILAVSVGAVKIPFIKTISLFFKNTATMQQYLIVRSIRLPRALAAVFAGAGLAAAGVVMQAILNNPLGSPFTLGLSHAAAFGAALSVMLFGSGSMQSSATDAVKITNFYLTTGSAFFFCLLTALIILSMSKIKKASPQVMILAGVALGSLFTAGTMFLQYFADDTQLAAMVFWTFGDVSRASWKELYIIMGTTITLAGYFIFNSWNYNAICSGDETARSLGINVEKIRLISMMAASLLAAVIISLLGIIGFVGLICPHIVRKLIGEDHRFLIPGSIITGSILLLAADTCARTVMLPHVLPVAILTSFLGAPLFLYLIIKGHTK
ncbi:MAG TPA: iron ABC transporter permease [Spirochaetota bacterium]|nr:iron ABC transporter permease [Spirochaetota bacterium]